MASEKHQQNGVLIEPTDKDSHSPLLPGTQASNTVDVGTLPGPRLTPQQGPTLLKKDNGAHTDNDAAELSEDGAGERPVRQKLKETSIAGVPRPNSPEDHAMASQGTPVARADSVSDTSSVEGRGRLRRKRSLGDMNEDEEHDEAAGGKNTDETGHRRKRSRDSKTDDESSDNQGRSKSGIRTPTEELKSTESDTANRILSPKKKRSRDQFDKDHLKPDSMGEKAEEGTENAKFREPFDKSKAMSANRRVEGEPEKKRHRDDSQDRSSQVDSDLVSKKASSLNPFSNTLSVSAFASMASKTPQLTSKDKMEKKEQPMTSASAFASSKLASFASSEKSPFSSLGAANSSALKSAPPAETTRGKEHPSTSSSAFAASPFAAAAASSPFGALSGGKSGFGRSGFATGFAAAAPKLGGGLAAFSTPTGSSSVLGNSSKSKTLGAAGSAHEDGNKVEKGKGEDDDKSTFEGLEEEKGDERFHEQQTETGEEGENTIFSCRGKLYHFNGKEWKERGVGVFKVNIREPVNDGNNTDGSEEEPQPGDNKTDEEHEKEEKHKANEDEGVEPKKKTARVIMRADGVWRVILNIPVFKGMKAGDPSGGPPKGKQVHFAGFEDGKSVPFLFRTGNDDIAKQLYTTLHTLQASL
ncbi:nuclear protein export protein Yrb2 [Histoplasma capsulatum G186AR]|uniref:Nuclear protein export protein Yrb2 n=1 Tax=Ajellomyces capsulatus TaxID=5037 RepID=A0A8H7YRF8_AJECA|nr:nuclear protein export protein Yrb2 [Histoplasma capsulatum]QSS74330.1 nuclear protein export protein Yrb2 [Histoplasma capsulatum G186AR]